MAFDSAIPLNRIAYGRNADMDLKARDGSAYRKSGSRNSPKQSVNISEDTLLRVARAKLGKAMGHKLAYNAQGAAQREFIVGSLLQVKA